MSNPSNVIKWPKKKRKTPHDVTSETIAHDVEEAQKARAELIVDEISTQIYSIAAQYNLNIETDNPDVLKNMALVVESLRALMLGVSGYSHPLHTISNNIFSVTGEGENQVVEINDALVEQTELQKK